MSREQWSAKTSNSLSVRPVRGGGYVARVSDGADDWEAAGDTVEDAVRAAFDAADADGLGDSE